MMKLGLDFGNVLKLKGDTLPMPGAVAAVRRLRLHFGDRIWIISKVDNLREADKVISFLERNWEFGISYQDRVKFCFGREEKAPVARELGLTHFVDDRTEVLSYMTTVPHRFALNPAPAQLDAFPPTGMIVKNNWTELLPAIEATFNHG